MNQTEILALAKLHGATVYTHRTMPDNPSVAFGNMAQLTAFAAALAAVTERKPLPAAVELVAWRTQAGNLVVAPFEGASGYGWQPLFAAPQSEPFPAPVEPVANEQAVYAIVFDDYDAIASAAKENARLLQDGPGRDSRKLSKALAGKLDARRVVRDQFAPAAEKGQSS